MWAALLGLNISSWLQGLVGHDEPGGRAHGASAFDENWPAFPLASRDTPGVSRSTLPPSTITVAWPTRGGPSTISSPNRARRSSAQFPTAPRGHDPGDRSSSDKSSEPWSDAPPVLRNASRMAAGNSNFVVTSPAASDRPLLADLDQTPAKGSATGAPRRCSRPCDQVGKLRCRRGRPRGTARCLRAALGATWPARTAPSDTRLLVVGPDENVGRVIGGDLLGGVGDEQGGGFGKIGAELCPTSLLGPGSGDIGSWSNPGGVDHGRGAVGGEWIRICAPQ